MVYPKAPIIEAIFDIQLTPEQEISHEVFAEAHKEIRDEFPIVNTTYFITGQLQVDTQNVGEIKGDLSKSIPVGKMFSNKDKNRHIQMKSNSYTFNMQPPYTKWEDFSAQAFKYFEFYKKFVPIKSINRVAVRYINQINIPLPLKNPDLNTFFTCVPKIPNGLPNELHNFLNQIQVPYKEDNTVLSITQTILQEKDNKLPFLLDIDVFKIKDIANDKSLVDVFNKLRDLKNLAFENSITEETKKLFH